MDGRPKTTLGRRSFVEFQKAVNHFSVVLRDPKAAGRLFFWVHRVVSSAKAMTPGSHRAVSLKNRQDLIKVLEGIGSCVVRQRGSHVWLKHEDGRGVTVPVHAGQDISRGLLRTILRDAELSLHDLEK